MKLKNDCPHPQYQRRKFGDSGQYAKWRIISIITVGIMVISAWLTANFIYQNIYVTLSNAHSIIILSSNLGVDTIDMKNYNLAEEKRKYKITNFVWDKKIRNIFNYDNITTDIATDTKK